MTNILHEIMKWSEEFEKPGNVFYEGVENAIDFSFEELRETERAYVHALNADFDNARELDAEVLDGFLDLTWVALNGAYKFLRAKGQPPSEARDNVVAALKTIYNANNAKRDAYGDILYNKEGKVIKPTGWKSPDLKEYV